MGKIEISLAADQGYFSGLFVTACSIAEHASEEVELRFNILDGGICAADCAYLEERVRHFHAKSAFRWLPVNEEMFARYPKWNGNRMAYARLILPSALEDVDWIVYCDVDFLWMRDVAELWAEREDGLALIGTKDGTKGTLDREETWFAKYGYPFDREKYFCSGLCFMNLKVFREKDLIAKCQEVMSHKDIQYPDQAALNVATWGIAKLVPQVWQRFTEVVTQEELDGGVVIHYAGQVPWTKMSWSQQLDDCRLIWHRHHARYRGISLWRSLRMFYSPARIVSARALTWLFRCPVLTQLMAFVARLGGHPGVYSYQKMRARRMRKHEG